MRPLHRKLLRDLLQMRSQALAIAAIIACGMAALICMATTYRGLLRSRDGYYLRQGMPDLFAPVKKAPRALAHELERLPGVRRLRPRIVFDVTIDIPGLSEPCSGRVLSLPDRERRIVGDIHIVRGRWFEGDGTRQVIVADAFARQHGLAPGDRLRVIMNNRKEALRIVATALAPEYVYMIRGGGEVLPDPVHFAVLWFSDSFAESVFDYRDAANEFVAQLERDAIPKEVIAAFDLRLDRYGALGAYARKDQLSHRFLSEEIRGLEGSTTFVPAIFLGVAAFVLHMLLARVVATQRTQIGVLFAFGYTPAELARHFLGFVTVIGIVGAAAGTAFGLWAADGMAGIYQEFYQFPTMDFRVELDLILIGLGTCVGFAILGALGAVRNIARLLPPSRCDPRPPRPIAARCSNAARACGDTSASPAAWCCATSLGPAFAPRSPWAASPWPRASSCSRSSARSPST